MSTSLIIEAIPTELLEFIFRLAKTGKEDPKKEYIYPDDIMDFKRDPNQVNPNEDHPLYKSLRQVCKRWESISTPFLFETVVLLSRATSWAHLDKIAMTSHLARHVQTIHLATLQHLPVYGNLKAFEEDHKELLSRDSEWIISSPNGGPFSDIPNSRADYFRRYQAWLQGEKVMAKHFRNGTAPKLSLNLLPHLQAVKTIGNDVLAVIKRQYNRRVSRDGRSLGRWRSYANASRREIETLVADRVTYGQDINAAHLETFIHAANVSDARFPILDLRNSQELLRVGSRFDASRLSLHGLRHLELRLGYHEWRVPYVCSATHPISPWLERLTGLEQLSITQNACCDEIDIFRIIAGVYFPKLAIVHLWGAQITYSRVMDFLERHRATVQTLRMARPRIAPEDWFAFVEGGNGGEWVARGQTLKFKCSST